MVAAAGVGFGWEINFPAGVDAVAPGADVPP
jgi:hypothetical protein